MRYQKSIYRLIFVIGMMINLQVQNIAAQGDVLTLIRNCETGCIDLQINGGFSPYDVEWQRLVGGQWTSLTGWPKSTLNGNDGVEDLCSDTNVSESTQFKVIVQDALCGTAEATITIVPCSPCDGLELISYDLTFPNSGIDGKIKNLSVNFAFPENLGGYTAPITVSLYNSMGDLMGTSTYISIDDDPINGGGGAYFENLQLGDKYCLTFEDVVGCGFTKCFTVQGESCPGQWGVDNVVVTPQKCNNKKGSISLDIKDGDNSCTKNIEWSNGASNVNTISNLEAGNYCISITGEGSCTGCLTVLCFDVKDESINQEISVTPIVSNYCAYIKEEGKYVFQWYGRVRLVLNGGNNQDVTVTWDVAPYASNGLHFIFDQPGKYCATIKNDCKSKIICVDILPQQNTDQATPVKECLQIPNDDENNQMRKSNYSDTQLAALVNKMESLKSLGFPDNVYIPSTPFNLISTVDLQNKKVYEVIDLELDMSIAQFSYHYEKVFRRVNIEDEFVHFELSPNPFNHKLAVYMKTSTTLQNVHVQIVNNLGKLISTKKFDVLNNNASISIDELENELSGLYFVKFIFNDNLTVFKKIVKL